MEIDGRRVGVIGTGSTAVQITGAIVDRVSSLSLFQRTAQWILPLQNPAYSRGRTGPVPHGTGDRWSRPRREFAQVFTEGFAEALVNAESPEMQMLEDMCRDNLEKNVADPVLREQLRPTYRAACKRLVLSEHFYDAIQSPNAHLVTASIDRVEPEGILTADGAFHELDVIVLATGFRVDQFVRPTKVLGEGGLDLDEVWSDGPVAYLSISVPGFPNFFMLNGPNGPVGNFSLIEVAELQMGYIMELIEVIRAGKATRLSAGTEATERFEATRRAAARSTIWMTGCRSWYLDRHGVPATWPWGFTRFREVMASPAWEDFDLAGPDRAAVT